MEWEDEREGDMGQIEGEVAIDELDRFRVNSGRGRANSTYGWLYSKSTVT